MGGVSPLTPRPLLILFVSGIVPPSLSIQMVVHDETAQEKAQFKNGLYTSRWLFFFSNSTIQVAGEQF